MADHTNPQLEVYADDSSASSNPPRGKAPTSFVAATRYKEPEITPEELSLVGWFRNLSDSDRAMLEGRYRQDREPVGPDGLERLLIDFGNHLRNIGRARRTAEIYLSDLSHFERYLLRSETDIVEISPKTVRGFAVYLVELDYSRVSISRMLTALKQFLRFLQCPDLRLLGLGQVPRKQDFVVKVPKKLPDHLTVEEVNHLLTAPSGATPYGLRDRAILEVAYGSGLRVSELRGLDLEHIDLGQETLFVAHGKGDKQRIGFFGKPARFALQQYLANGRPYLTEGVDDPALFVSRYGTRCSVRWLEKMVQRYGVLAGIKKKIYPHLLRHSFATHMMENGAGIRQIQELLGHSSIMTTQVYTHVTQAEAKKSLNEFHPRAKGV